MNPTIIAGYPLDNLINDLASGDQQRREFAGKIIYRYCHKAQTTDADDWDSPDEGALKSLRSAVATVFQQRPSPSNVKALVDYTIRAHRICFHKLLDDRENRSLPTKTNMCIFFATQVVLQSIGPGAADALPLLIEMLSVTVESGDVSSSHLAWIAAHGIQSMGEKGAPAFDALFKECTRIDDDPISNALITISAESADAYAKAVSYAQAGDADRRRVALQLLDKVGPRNAALREVAVQALNDTDEQIKFTGGIILRRHFKEDSVALATLERARKLAIKPPSTSQCAPESPWVRKGKSMSEWLIEITNADEQQRDTACDCLAEMYYGYNGIVGDQSDREWRKYAPDEFQKEIARVFAQPDFPATQVLQGVIHIYRSISEVLNISGKAMLAMPPAEMTQHSVGLLRKNVLRIILSNVGNQAKDVLPEVLEMLNSKSNSESNWNPLSETGATVIGNLVDHDMNQFSAVFKKAVPKHGRQWPNPWEDTLVKIAQQNSEAIDQLVKMLDCGKIKEKRVAAAILTRLRGKALPALEVVLKLADGGRELQQVVVGPLSVLSGISEEAKTKIVQMLDHPDVDTRACALSGCANFSDLEYGRSLLEKGLHDTDPYVRCTALCELCDLPIPDDAKVLYCLDRINDDEGFDDWIPSEQAYRQLEKLKSTTPAVLPTLLKQFGKNIPINIVENAGLDAKQALPLLKERFHELALNDPLITTPLA